MYDATLTVKQLISMVFAAWQKMIAINHADAADFEDCIHAQLFPLMIISEIAQLLHCN